MVDKIPIMDASQLEEYGFDYTRFKRMTRDKIGGYEFHGPCPTCGGIDRLLISNGMYYCRNSDGCGERGSLAFRGKKSLTEEDRRQISDRMAKAEREERVEREKRIRDLTKTRRWEEFHNNLLVMPKLLQQLEEQDGILLRAVKHFRLGYNPTFHFSQDGELKEAPALTFPILWKNTCVNIRHRILLPDEQIVGDKYRPIWRHLGLAFFIADFPRCDFVVFVEGEKKAIVLWTFGIPAIALWGVHCWKDEWIPQFVGRYKRRYVAFDEDNDQVLQAEILFARAVSGKILYLGGKPDNLLLSGKLTPQGLVNIIRQRNQEPW